MPLTVKYMEPEMIQRFILANGIKLFIIYLLKIFLNMLNDPGIPAWIMLAEVLACDAILHTQYNTQNLYQRPFIVP